MKLLTLVVLSTLALSAQDKESTNNYGMGPEPPHGHEILQHFFAGGSTPFTSESGWKVVFESKFELYGDRFFSSYDIESSAPESRPAESGYAATYFSKLNVSGPSPYEVNLYYCEEKGICKREGNMDRKIVEERLSTWFETDEHGNLWRREKIRTWGVWRAFKEGDTEGVGTCSMDTPGMSWGLWSIKLENCFQESERSSLWKQNISNTAVDANKEEKDLQIQ